MPQGDHIELHRKRYGRQLDHEERTRKKEARSVKKRAAYAQKALGLKGKMFAKQRYREKAVMKKTIAMHEEKDKNRKVKDAEEGVAKPAYLLEREQVRGVGGWAGCGCVAVAVACTRTCPAPPFSFRGVCEHMRQRMHECMHASLCAGMHARGTGADSTPTHRARPCCRWTAPRC